MTDAARFSARLNCRTTEVLFERLQGMVPSIAEDVETIERGYSVKFAGGEAKLRCAKDSLWIEIEADDAELCMGIRAALAATLIDDLMEPALLLAWQR